MTRTRSGTALLLAFAATAAIAAPPDAAELETAGVDPFDGASPPPLAAPTGVVVRALLVALEGQAGGGSTIDALNTPFTNADGVVGFTGGLANTDDFVWFDTGIAWRNSDHTPEVLTGAESTMGIDDAGGFIYSPAVDGDDAVWTEAGLLLRENTPAPDFPPGTVTTFHSRPTRIPSGRSYWVSGFNASGGTTTEGRMLYTTPDGTAGNTVVVLRSDDVIGAFTIARPSGVDFDYDFSEDGAHHIQVLLMDTGSTANDGFVYVDGGLVARENDLTGTGDRWDNFDAVAIDSSGHYLFSGDTDGAATSDEFIAYDGLIAIREGDTLDGLSLTSTASVQALSIADDGVAAHIWSTATTEALFATCDASDLAASQLVLQVGDALDLDGDGTGDGTVTDFNASSAVGPGLDLTSDGFVFVEVDLDQGAGALEAVVRLALPCGIFADGFESGDTSAWSSTIP